MINHLELVLGNYYDVLELTTVLVGVVQSNTIRCLLRKINLMLDFVYLFYFIFVCVIDFLSCMTCSRLNCHVVLHYPPKRALFIGCEELQRNTRAVTE